MGGSGERGFQAGRDEGDAEDDAYDQSHDHANDGISHVELPGRSPFWSAEVYLMAPPRRSH